MTQAQHYAYFITPHGYGHASRAAAVMNAIHARQPEAVFEIFTRVPVWFFHMSLRADFHYHEVLSDIGLVQATSMEEDLPETVRRLGEILPFRSDLTDSLAREVRQASCSLVLCDIAPLGIAVARKAGVPSVLVENFTWDWIYEGYLDQEPRFAPFIEYLKEQFASASYHVRTDPACSAVPPADLTTHVVSRPPRTARDETRRKLGVAQDAPMVMVTMGGILTEYPFLDRLQHSPDVHYLIPGGSERYEQRGSLVLIPHHSDFYHPDLVEASDAVIGKLGYSTLAEAYAAGLPFAYIPRDRFRESQPMSRFAREEMGAVELPEARFFSGAWLDLVPGLLARPRRRPVGPNGADQIADYLLKTEGR